MTGLPTLLNTLSILAYVPDNGVIDFKCSYGESGNTWDRNGGTYCSSGATD